MDASKGSLPRTLALVLPITVGLVASSILLVDYLRPEPLFCDQGAGCAALRLTAYASVLGIPTPVFGVLGFLALGALALARGGGARTAMLGVSFAAALVGALLISVQAGLGVWCKFCVMADSSSLVLFGMAVWRRIAEFDPPEARAPRAGLGSVFGLALLVPITIGVFKKTPPIPIPDVIARELAQSPKGDVTVVDFADFECPFCRMAHAELASVVAKHKDKVRVIRKNVPLTRIHPHALEAARAACCGDQMGKGDAMAEALFTAPVDDLTPDGCAKLAASLGLDEQSFRKCTQDPETDKRIHQDQDTFKAADGHVLPTLWIDGLKVEGFQPDQLQKLVTRAIEKRS